MSDAIVSSLLPSQRARLAAAHEALAEAWRFAGNETAAMIAEQIAKRFRDARDEPLSGACADVVERT